MKQESKNLFMAQSNGKHPKTVKRFAPKNKAVKAVKEQVK